MSTGPTAKVSRRRSRGTLSERVRQTETLLHAWHAIRRNGETSRSRKTREEVKNFASELPRKLRHIQEALRKEPYQFAPQIGVTPEKSKGKGKRPLVVARLEDRIVQRAILDVLQEANELPEVRQVLATPTSIGGIRGRGVEHAIDLIQSTYEAGRANFVAGSDISGFFTKIKQTEVVDFICNQTSDEEFVGLFSRALRVDLANADMIDPQDLAMFPTDDEGVAQGCPLSAFAGNVALRAFDEEFNQKGITCVRYIDDFILLGRQRAAVEKAFDKAREHLAGMNMSIYRPDDRPDKAFFGSIDSHFEFLGYKLVPGLYPPAPKNRDQIIKSVSEELECGKQNILQVIHRDGKGRPMQLYAQTLVVVDKLLRAWSGSFRASKCIKSANEIDDKVNDLISGFIAFYRKTVSERSKMDRRRALGVHVLADDIRHRLK